MENLRMSATYDKLRLLKKLILHGNFKSPLLIARLELIELHAG
jgi:hypothetical protein